MPFTTPDPGSSADQTQPTPPAQYPYPQFYDPYGPFVPPMAPVPPNFSGRPGVHHHGPYYYQESGFCELILVMLALLLWLYSFYRLYLVWQNTLNFSESSIQGPQGWDFLVTWIVERIRIKNLRVPGMSTRRRGATGNIGQSCLAPSESHPNSHPFDNCDTAEDIELGLRARDKKLDSNVDLGNAMNSEGFDYENPSLLVLENENNLSCPYEVHEQEKSSPGGHSLEMSFVSSQSQLKQYLSTACLEDKAELQDQQEDAITGGEKTRTVSELSDVWQNNKELCNVHKGIKVELYEVAATLVLERQKVRILPVKELYRWQGKCLLKV